MNDTLIENQKLSRREREKAAHKQEIMDAAIKVFAEKGYAASTLEEIAQAADFSKGAVYLYFDNKEDLLFTILKQSIENWESFSLKCISGSMDFRAELTLFFKTVAEHIFKNSELFRLLTLQHMALFRGLSDEKSAELLKAHEEMKRKMKTRVEKAIADGEVRDMVPEAILGTIHGSIDAMIFNCWNCETPKKLREAIDSFMDVLFNGIASEKEI